MEKMRSRLYNKDKEKPSGESEDRRRLQALGGPQDEAAWQWTHVGLQLMGHENNCKI
jgi:hypothetical protein